MIYKIMASFVLVAIMAACNDEIPLTLQEEYVGLDASSTQLLYLREGKDLPVPSNIRAQLIAAQRATPVNFTFEILPSSTAIANLHYTVSGNTGTIPANSSFGDLPIMILPDNIEPGEVLRLNIRVTGGDLGVTEAFGTVNYTIQVLCPNTIPLNRTWTVTILDGAFGAAGTSRNDVTITDAGDGTLLISDITAGVLPALGCCDPDESANILNICDVITIDRAGADASFSYETNPGEGFGAGSWDAATQTLILPWWEPANGFGAIVEFKPN